MFTHALTVSGNDCVHTATKTVPEPEEEEEEEPEDPTTSPHRRVN